MQQHETPSLKQTSHPRQETWDVAPGPSRSKSVWCQTAESVYRTHVDPDGKERTTRYRKSTALDDHYVPDVDVEVVPRHVHPVCVMESNYGVRPSQDDQISAPIMPPTAPDRVTVLHKDEL